MKYVFITFFVFFIIFAVFSGLIIYKTMDGSLDLCLYKFEDCSVSNPDKNQALKILSCSNKAFVCNVKGLYQSFFDMDGLDNDYNDYMQERIKQELEIEAKIKALPVNQESVKENKE